MTAGGLAVLSVLVAVGGVAAYFLLLGFPLVRNHPEGYVAAAAVATVLAVVAWRRSRRWPSWLALGVSTLVLLLTAWFNFVGARVPDTPVAVRVGEPAPEFTLPDALGRPVALADYRGKKSVVLVFYRGYW
jgi:hypothetical protein